MSIALNQARPAETGRSIGRASPWAVVGLALIALVSYVAFDLRNPSRLHASQILGDQSAPGGKPAPAGKAAAPASASVTLSELKYQQAKIATEPARIERLSTEVGVV